MALILKTDFTQVELNPKNGTDFSLEELQKIVGGYIEIVNLNEEYIMVVNEEGKLLGLPANPSATIIARQGLIVGDVLVCRREEVK